MYGFGSLDVVCGPHRKHPFLQLLCCRADAVANCIENTTSNSSSVVACVCGGDHVMATDCCSATMCLLNSAVAYLPCCDVAMDADSLVKLFKL
jgi:hypothetical protein